MAEPGPSGGPLDPRMLAEEARRDTPRPLPWRKLGAFFVPAAALAAGVGLQYLFEGPRPRGDALVRWLVWSSGAGLALGAAAGVLACPRPVRRAAWALLGAASPWALAGLALLGVEVARPLRAAIGRERVARCRQTRKACTAVEFRTGCAAAAAPDALARGSAALGAPAQQLCGAQGCTYRWVYDGPWMPDDLDAPRTLWCSVVADGRGTGVRFALVPGPSPQP